MIGRNDYYLFLQRMKQDLLDGVNLKSNILGGACEECVNLHDEKDIPQLQRVLSQPTLDLFRAFFLSYLLMFATVWSR